MSREINMYNPSSPGACWVMECQECFGAVLITWILDYPLINRPIAAKTTQPPKDCLRFCDDFSSHNGNYMGPPTSALFAVPCDVRMNETARPHSLMFSSANLYHRSGAHL